MQTISVRRRMNQASARNAVESLLGRKVADQEHVTVMPFLPARRGEPDRTRAVHDLIEDLDSLAASAATPR